MTDTGAAAAAPGASGSSGMSAAAGSDHQADAVVAPVAVCAACGGSGHGFRYGMGMWAAGAGNCRCGACKLTRYCSTECQKSHWRAHKAWCGRPVVGPGAAKPSYDDFAISATDIGAGNFSRVMKARHRGTGQEFAIKEMEKSRVRKLAARHKNIHNEIMMEKTVLSKLCHRNLVRLLHTFSDDRGLYFLYELITGGELWCTVIRDGVQVGCDLNVARYYLLQVLDALEYMHSMGVVHRDLKPENAMLTRGGVVKLVDFGTCKDLVDTKYNGPEFVGTPDYMSPEAVDSKPTSPASDLWAFGCMVYQFAVGRTPFKAPSDYLVLRRVEAHDLHFPPHMHPAARDLAAKLLVVDPTARLCGAACPRGTPVDYTPIRRHPFFADVQPPCPVPRLAWCATQAVADHIAATLGQADAATTGSGRRRHDGDAATRYLRRVSWVVAALRSGVAWELQQQLRLRIVLHLPAVQAAFHPRDSFMWALRRVGAAPFEPYETLGLTRDLHGSFKDVCKFVVVPLPSVVNGTVLHAVRACVAAANRVRPAPVCAMVVTAALRPSTLSRADADALVECLAALSPSTYLVLSASAAEALDNGSAAPVALPRHMTPCHAAWAGGARAVFVDNRSPGVDLSPQFGWLKPALETVKYGSQHTVVLCEQPLWLPPHVVATGLTPHGVAHVTAAGCSHTAAAVLDTNCRLLVAVEPSATTMHSAVVPAPALRQVRRAQRDAARGTSHTPADGSADDGSSDGDDSGRDGAGSDADGEGDAGDGASGRDTRLRAVWLPPFEVHPAWAVVTVREHRVECTPLRPHKPAVAAC